MSDALDYAAQKGTTSHEKLRAIDIAELINVLSGGAVIAPWEVDQLDDEWIDSFKGFASIPKRRAEFQKFNNRLAEIRKKHPTYRKYL